MLEKTQGIVLTTIPYNDRTLLVHILTEALGKVTCRVSASRSPRRAISRLMLAPMTLLELIVSRAPQQEICTIREARLLHSPHGGAASGPMGLQDLTCMAQCAFLAELLDKTVREVERNERLWSFVRQGIELMALAGPGQANFHLIFTSRLAYLLGFRVDTEHYAEGMMFDVSEGVFTHGPIYHPYYLHPESAAWLMRLLRTDFAHMAELTLSRTQRDTLLDMMLTYLRIHLPEMGEVRSLAVLKEVFD